MRTRPMKTWLRTLFGSRRRGKAGGVIGHVDTAFETFIRGWALDTADPDRAVGLEVLHGGAVIARGVTDIPRDDVAKAGHGKLLTGFRLDLSPRTPFRDGDKLEIRDAATGRPILGSPVRIDVNPSVARFRDRLRTLPAARAERFKRRFCNRNALGVSVVMPVYNTPPAWLEQAIASVVGQWHARWELICVDDGSTEPGTAEMLDRFAAMDDRVRILRPGTNRGISAATNLGIAAARHELLAFMDHDDILEPSALHVMARAFEDGRVDLAYSDEVVTDEDPDHFLEFSARPAFSLDYYLSHPYFVHLVVCRTSLAREVGGLDEGLSVSQDVDFVLRALERAKGVAHVPLFLYRWRTHRTSTGHTKLDQVTANTCRALSRSLARLHPGCEVAPGHTFNTYRVTWPDVPGKTLIVVPTRNALSFLKTTIASIERHTDRREYELVIVDHDSDDPATQRYLAGLAERGRILRYSGAFNFARMNNEAVREAGAAGAYILFLNNDVEILSDGWLGRLRSLAGRPDVGAVGPMLVYGNDLVQHAGVILGFNGTAEHAFKLVPAYHDGRRNSGFNAALTATRDVSAVTAACLMMRRCVFEEVGGFDEGLKVGFNDTDLCLRVRRRGYRVLYDGDLVIRHYESATRNAAEALLKHPDDTAAFKARWKGLIEGGDPFYNPMLSPEGTDHMLRRSKPLPRQIAVRVAGASFGPPSPVAPAAA